MPTEVADGKISGKGGCPKYPTASLALRDEAKTCDGISKKLQNLPKTKNLLVRFWGNHVPRAELPADALLRAQEVDLT